MDLATLSPSELETWLKTVRQAKAEIEEEVRRRFQAERQSQRGLAQPEQRQGELFG